MKSSSSRTWLPLHPLLQTLLTALLPSFRTHLVSPPLRAAPAEYRYLHVFIQVHGPDRRGGVAGLDGVHGDAHVGLHDVGRVPPHGV